MAEKWPNIQKTVCVGLLCLKPGLFSSTFVCLFHCESFQSGCGHVHHAAFVSSYLMMIYWALIYLSASVIKILKGTWPWHHHIAQLLPDFTQKRAAFDFPGLWVWGQWSAAGWIGEWLPSWLSSECPRDRQLWTQDFIPGTDLSSRRVFKALEICRDLHESQTSLRQQQMSWSRVFISVSFCFLGAGCPLGKQCAIKEAFNAVGH